MPSPGAGGMGPLPPNDNGRPRGAGRRRVPGLETQARQNWYFIVAFTVRPGSV